MYFITFGILIIYPRGVSVNEYTKSTHFYEFLDRTLLFYYTKVIDIFRKDVTVLKALASDFDGTFYFMSQPEPMKKYDIDAIKEFQAQGQLFGFCTGRPIYGVLDYLDNQIAADFYITNSGATIHDKYLNLLFEKVISKEITDALISYGLEHQYSVDFHMNGKFYTFGKSTSFITDEIYSLDEIYGNVHSVSYDAKTEENAEELAKHMNNRFHRQIAAFRNKQYVDIVPFGCSKGLGIDTIRNMLKIDTFAGIGDSMNDLPMLEKADVPFTFPYAPKILQEKSRYIVNSVAEAIDFML